MFKLSLQNGAISSKAQFSITGVAKLKGFILGNGLVTL